MYRITTCQMCSSVSVGEISIQDNIQADVLVSQRTGCEPQIKELKFNIHRLEKYLGLQKASPFTHREMSLGLC